MIHILEEEKPDAVLIAGDIYDKPSPPVEAVELFDDFLVSLTELETSVFVISGNHDSPERLAFGGRLMSRSGVYMAPVYQGEVRPVSLRDKWGSVNIYMLPFLKPAHVRRWYPEEAIASYTEALAAAVAHMRVSPGERNVLLTHQFVTGAVPSDSEEISVGGTEQVDGAVFDVFDYVALGHLHRAQPVGRETMRYCGTPLKYSFSEAEGEKSVTVAELGEKGKIDIRTIPLTPLRDLRERKGTYEEVTAGAGAAAWEGPVKSNDYLHIILTDEEDILEAVRRLRIFYPNLMKLDYDNRRTRGGGEIVPASDLEKKTPLELFAEFYEKQNNQPMSGEQARFVADCIRRIWEEEA